MKNTILLCIALSTLYGCVDIADPEPKYPSSMSANIDTSYWKANGEPPDGGCTAYWGYGRLQVWGSDGWHIIIFTIHDFKGTGRYLLNNKNYAAYILDDRSAFKTSYHTDSIHTGTVTITKLDQGNEIVSGTFAFRAFGGPFLGDTATVSVTGGRFDIDYGTH